MEITKFDVARLFLQKIRIENLRNEARQNHEWSNVYRGFRPQYLTRTVFLQRAGQFSLNQNLLETLCRVFLDNVGSPAGIDLRQRFAAAAEFSDLETSIKDLCRYLSNISLADLPARNEKNDVVMAEVISESAPGDIIAATPSAEEENNGIQQTEPIREPPEAINEITPNLPECITQRAILEWQPPHDQIQEAQQAVTCFERVLVAFVQRQLEALYGDAWLRKGCGPWRDKWRAKSQNNKAIDPKTLLGFAELGEIKEVIIYSANWPAFKAYFPSKEYVDQAFSNIIPLRTSGAHGSQREIYFLEQIAGLKDIVELAAIFHPETANEIDELFRKVMQIQEMESSELTMLSKVQTNLGDLQTSNLVGRDAELHKLQEFWNDEFATAVSITGEGGIGKTAILDEFIRRVLSRPCPSAQRPDPEVVVYLTAKDNYLHHMQPAPESKRFRTLHRIYEVTLEIMGEEWEAGKTTEQMRKDVLSLAKDARILFALDNLESLSKEEWESVSSFVADLPIPSKAILTTRENRRSGRHLRIEGLPFQDARNLLLSRLEGFSIDLSAENLNSVDELVKCTNGFPLSLVCCAILIRNGHSIEDTVSNLRGKEFIDILRFSFESSIKQLSSEALQVLYFLALSKVSRSRKHILPIVRDDEQLDDVFSELDMMNFIKRNSEESKKIQFSVDNPQLKDYVLKRAPEILADNVSAKIRKHANVLLISAGSPSVLVEVQKAIQRAREVSRASWPEAIDELEAARKTWGEDPGLLADLGYYYFRNENRPKARFMLEKAINDGYETPEVYFHLALVCYYEHNLGAALSSAETALTLRTVFPKAERLAGECLWEQFNREEFTLSEQARLQILKRSLDHLKKSLIPDERNLPDVEHNRLVRGIIARAEERNAELQVSINAPMHRQSYRKSERY